MNWEKVKGFCRRQTQKFNQEHRNAAETKDEVAEQSVAATQTYRRVAQGVMTKMDRINNNLADTLLCLEGVKDDLRLVEYEEFAASCNRLEMLTTALRRHQETLQVSLAAAVTKLHKYIDETASLENVAEDRKMKKLEFDFFRNKVAALRANPPGDPARIPRNDLRVSEWQRQYEEANERLKQLTHNLSVAGVRAFADVSGTLTTDLSKYFNDSALTWRSMYGGGAVAAAVGAVAAALPKLPQPSVPIPSIPQAAAAAASAIRAQSAVAAPQPQPTAAASGELSQPSFAGAAAAPAPPDSSAAPPAAQSASPARNNNRVRPSASVDDPFAM